MPKSTSSTIPEYAELPDSIIHTDLFNPVIEPQYMNFTRLIRFTDIPNHVADIRMKNVGLLLAK